MYHFQTEAEESLYDTIMDAVMKNFKNLEDRCKSLETEIIAIKNDNQSSRRHCLPKLPNEYFEQITPPSFRFGKLIKHISVNDEDVTTLFDSSVKSMLNELLTRNFHELYQNGNIPVHVYQNKLYVYDINRNVSETNNSDTHLVWQPISYKETELIYLLNSIQKTIISRLIAWKAKQDDIRISADVCDLIYQKTLQKILKLNCKSRTIIMVIRVMMSKICDNL
jgi:hypothetical protein